MTHLEEHNPHIPDRDPKMDSMPDPQINSKPAEGDPAGSYRFNEAVHPLFVNRLLDKIRRMEIEIKEVVELNDSVKAENTRLQENSDSADKCILRLKRHKNMLIRKVQKFYRENHRNKERICELNAQVALMQLKGPSQDPFSQMPANGVNI